MIPDLSLFLSISIGKYSLDVYHFKLSPSGAFSRDQNQCRSWVEYFSGEVLFVDSQVELICVKAIQLGISQLH